eukprot:sb/3477848/
MKLEASDCYTNSKFLLLYRVYSDIPITKLGYGTPDNSDISDTCPDNSDIYPDNSDTCLESHIRAWLSGYLENINYPDCPDYPGYPFLYIPPNTYVAPFWTIFVEL